MAYGFLEKMLTELTTAYSRDKDSNIGKLFQVTAGVYESAYSSLEQAKSIRDINNAKGYTLDQIGRNWGVKRDGLEDDLYRILILVKVISLINGGDIDTVINAAAVIFQVEATDIVLTEVFPAKIKVDAPFDAVTATVDLGRLRIVMRFIKRILAAGVGFDFGTYQKLPVKADLYIGDVRCVHVHRQ